MIKLAKTYQDDSLQKVFFLNRLF